MTWHYPTPEEHAATMRDHRRTQAIYAALTLVNLIALAIVAKLFGGWP
jgi:hypothetical protein